METSQLLHKWERDTLPINSQSKRQPHIQNELNNTIQSKTLPLDNNNLKHELAINYDQNHYFTSETNQITSQSGLSQLTLIQGMFTKNCDNNTETS